MSKSGNANGFNPATISSPSTGPAQAGTAVTAPSQAAPPIGRAFPWLAPLAGHTDLVFRTLCREQGAAAACTEMVSAKGLVYGEGSGGKNGQTKSGISATRELLRSTAADSPLVVQLFGEDPHFLGRAVELLRSWGFAWFDLNLGCSVPKVVKTGAGAALARSIPNTLACAKAMIAAAGPVKDFSPPADNSNNAFAQSGGPKQNAALEKSLPRGRVGFKLRLGWTREEENYLELARELEQCGAGWLTLHPRYAKQGFSGSPDYAALEKLAGQLEIPLMASGDLFNAATALRRLDESGASGVMFGRGALHNPAVFRDYLDLLGNGKSITAPENEHAARTASQPEFLRALILRHAELASEFASAQPPRRKRANKAGQPEQPGQPGLAGLAGLAERAARPDQGLLKLRGAVPRYIKDLPGSRAFRVNLSACRDWNDFYKLLENYFTALQMP